MFLFLLGLFSGPQGVAFQFLLAKMIPIVRRGQLQGWRNLTGGIIAASLSYFAGKYLIGHNVFGNGYSTTFTLAFILTSLGLTAFRFLVREPEPPTIRPRTPIARAHARSGADAPEQSRLHVFHDRAHLRDRQPRGAALLHHLCRQADRLLRRRGRLVVARLSRRRHGDERGLGLSRRPLRLSLQLHHRSGVLDFLDHSADERDARRCGCSSPSSGWAPAIPAIR